MTPRHSAGLDNDGLQTDVMRFMAIIGFCLVAIFALVRNTEATATQSAHPPTTTHATDAVPAPERSDNMQPPLADTPVATRPQWTEPEPIPATRPVTPSATPAPADAPPPAAPTPEAEPGLTLSFSSERDFMRLIGGGTVELFVVSDRNAPTTWRFDPANQFVSSPAPGRIYELLPTTIPTTVVAALQRQTGAPASPTWGVRLPASVERAISEQRQRHDHGTLLIDRHGQVRHVPAA